MTRSAARPGIAPSPGFEAGFHTLDDEIECDGLPVTGTFPDWLEGSLLRIGPARFEAGERSVAHWFDGLAMLHRFGFEGGRVSYRNRFLRSAAFAASDAGRIRHAGFMTDPCRTLFGRVRSWFLSDATDNANIAVRVADDVGTAMTETPLAVSFDPDTLATLGPHSHGAGDGGAGSQVATAHPLHDGTHEYTVTIAMGRRSVYRVLVDDGTGAGRRTLAEVPCRRPAYLHSFGMSARFLVLTEIPLRVDPVRLKFSNAPFIENYRWTPERGTRFTVLDKASGRTVAVATGEPCFAFHHVDAHEAPGEGGDRLHVDVLAYPDASIIDRLRLERLRRGEPIDAVAHLTRFDIPLLDGPGRAPSRVLCDVPIELPRTDERRRRAGLPATIVWGNGLTRSGDFVDDVTRIDIGTIPPSVLVWHEPGCYPGEPVFVPRPDGADEDDGVLLSVVLDARAARSFLLVLEARTLTELARATLPHAVPFGFHGEHVGRSADR